MTPVRRATRSYLLPVVRFGLPGYPALVRRRSSQLSLAIVASLALTAGGIGAVVPASAAEPAAKASAQTKKKTAKKKKTTSQRVTALSRSLNRAKAQQRAAQKQLDALVKQQASIDEQISKAVGAINGAGLVGSAEGIAALIQDPASGIPQLLEDIQSRATDGIRALLASQEYAVAVVTVGDAIASPTLVVSPDIPDIGAPVTFTGSVPVIVPPGANNAPVHVRVGAFSLENDGDSVEDPAFVAGLNRMSVVQDGYTGNLGDAILRGGGNGVSRTVLSNGNVDLCEPAAQGCGAAVWSGPNPNLQNLPFWPVHQKLVSFGDKPGVEFDIARMTALSAPGRLASLTNNGTPPIYASTNGADRNGVALLRVDFSITAMDLSVNPADPVA